MPRLPFQAVFISNWLGIVILITIKLLYYKMGGAVSPGFPGPEFMGRTDLLPALACNSMLVLLQLEAV